MTQRPGPAQQPASADRPPRSVTVVIPMYNEAATISELLRRLQSVTMPCEAHVVVVDDASSDGSPGLAAAFAENPDFDLTLVRLPTNGGKGNAVAAGVAVTTTTHVVVLDADLELAPEDLPAVVGPVACGEADAVVGVRQSVKPNTHVVGRARSAIYGLANRGISEAFNVAHRSRLHDVMNGYKVLPVATYRHLDLTQAGFAVEIELAAGMLNHGLRVVEVPVSYAPRGRKEGKKIRARDTIAVLLAIVATRGRTRGG